jgi:hypothetical protein
MSSETTPSQENQQDNLIPTHQNHCAEPLVADAVSSLDSHESGGEQGDQFLLSAALGEHFRLGQGKGAASLDHSPTGKDAFACGRSDKVDLKLGGQNASVSRHEAECGVARGAIGDGAHSSGVDKPVLL